MKKHSSPMGFFNKANFSYDKFLGRYVPLKYKNKPTTIDNIKFASRKEAKRYIILRLLLKTRKITNLKLQPRFDFPMGFFYKADFSYKEKGKLIVEDVKGVKTQTFILKEKCFRYFYPDIELRVIK